MDRNEVREEIARALEAVADYWATTPVGQMGALAHVAAELRQPAPAIEPKPPISVAEAMALVGTSPPQPTLAERCRKQAGDYGRGSVTGQMILEAADALAAADKLRAEHEALRERYARLDAAAAKVTASLAIPGWSQTVDDALELLELARQEAPDADQ